MTATEYKQRQSELDERDLNAVDKVVAAGCLVVTLAWVGLLAHWGASFLLQIHPSAVLELIERLKAAEKDAAKWQAYQKRKQEVIAAGMGRKIMRDLDPYAALPAFYAAMKEKP